jgi:hypothetical protein
MARTAVKVEKPHLVAKVQKENCLSEINKISVFWLILVLFCISSRSILLHFI